MHERRRAERDHEGLALDALRVDIDDGEARLAEQVAELHAQDDLTGAGVQLDADLAWGLGV
jgi:hypothetical protein